MSNSGSSSTRTAFGLERLEPPSSLSAEPTTAADRPSRNLTEAEARVLVAIAEGDSYEEAAAKLVLSPQTIQSHLKNIRQALGSRSTSNSVAIAIRHGFI